MKGEKAVSEVIGFVIILSIIFTSIGIVYTNAIPVLENTEETEHLNNAERAMITLQSNVEEMLERGVPKRGTEMRLRAGELEMPEVEEAQVVFNFTGIGNLSGEQSQFPVPVKYSLADRSVVYENGAVIRNPSGNGSTMVRNPGWIINEDRVMLTTVDTRLRGVGRRVGDGTAIIRMERGGDGSIDGNVTELSSSDTVNVTVVSENSQAWAAYFRRFDDRPGFSLDHDAEEGRVEMNFEGVDGQRFMYTRVKIEMLIS
jgi:hypothetical protein